MDVIFWAPVLLAGAVAGGSCGILGVFIVGMRIPFLAVCVAHAALAGAVFGSLCGLHGSLLMLPALAGALMVALVLGLANPARLHADDNVVLGLLFSLTMGLAFLGIGLHGTLGRSDSDVRALLWGSLAFCRWNDVAWIAVAAVALGLFVALFFKELRAILFSREGAAAVGIQVSLVWTMFLVLTAGVLTVNFQTVGGLMIYSLVTNPAAAAVQLVRGCRRVLLVAACIGTLVTVGGFVLSAFTDLPSGATIVLLSSGVVLVVTVLMRNYAPG